MYKLEPQGASPGAPEPVNHHDHTAIVAVPREADSLPGGTTQARQALGSAQGRHPPDRPLRAPCAL